MNLPDGLILVESGGFGGGEVLCLLRRLAELNRPATAVLCETSSFGPVLLLKEFAIKRAINDLSVIYPAGEADRVKHQYRRRDENAPKRLQTLSQGRRPLSTRGRQKRLMR